MKLRVHNAFEATSLIRESNEGRGHGLPLEDVAVVDHDGNHLGLAGSIGTVDGHVLIPGQITENPGGRVLKAWQAMLKVATDIVKFYKDDLYVHDAAAILKHPNDSFLYFVRECGTHFVPLQKGGPTSGENRKIVETLMGMSSSQHFHWNGRAMQSVDHEKVLALLKSHTATPVYL